MPRRTRRHPCVDNTTICAHFHRRLTETKHPILAMLCPMLIFLFTFFRRHALQSSDVIDERAVPQYASLFSSFMLTICYDTFRFYTHRRVLICCPITLHVLSYSLGFVSILYMHVPHIIAILSSRRPECPFQFKQVRVSSSSFKKERKS